MWSYIGNLLAQFFTPLGVIGLLLFITLFLVKKHPKTAKWFIVTCLLVVGVLGNTYFSSYITRSMEWRYMPVDAAVVKADAIVLLADGVLSPDTPRQRVEVDDEADRVLYAANLYQQGAAPYILVSGGHEAANAARTLLMELGIPEADIFLQDQSLNTMDDVVNATTLLLQAQAQTVLVVTSAARMDRVVFLFNQAPLEVIPAPCDYRVTQGSWHAQMQWDWKQVTLNLMPRADAFEQSTGILREYLSLAFYRLKAIL